MKGDDNAGGFFPMIDSEKLRIVLNDKRTSDRVRLMFLLLEKGLTVKDIIALSAKDLQILNQVESGELLFKKYTARKGVMDTIIKSNLLFPSKTGEALTEIGILGVLRRPCRLNGFQLKDIGFHGLTSEKVVDISTMSLEEIQKYIEEQNKKQ